MERSFEQLLRRTRVRWAAIGAALAVTFGAGGLVSIDALSTPRNTDTAGHGLYVLDEPERINDDRFYKGEHKLAWDYDAFTQYEMSRVQVAGVGSIPTDADAVELNFEVYSAIPATTGWITIFDCGEWEENGVLVIPAGTQPMSGLDGDPFPGVVGTKIPNVSLGNFITQPDGYDSSAALGSTLVRLSETGAICTYRESYDSPASVKWRVAIGALEGTDRYLGILKNPSYAIYDVTAYVIDPPTE